MKTRVIVANAVLVLSITTSLPLTAATQDHSNLRDRARERRVAPAPPSLVPPIIARLLTKALRFAATGELPAPPTP